MVEQESEAFPNKKLRTISSVSSGQNKFPRCITLQRAARSVPSVAPNKR